MWTRFDRGLGLVHGGRGIGRAGFLDVGVADIGEEGGHQRQASPRPISPSMTTPRQARAASSTTVPSRLKACGLGAERLDEGGDAEDQQDVRRVRAHDIADGNSRRARERRLDARQELGRRGAEADEGQADQQRREAEPPGDGDGAADEAIAAGDEEHEGRARAGLDKKVERRHFRHHFMAGGKAGRLPHLPVPRRLAMTSQPAPARQSAGRV
jgi:hypothetical protein